MKRRVFIGIAVVLIAAVLFLGGCESSGAKGAGLGALAGAGVGALAGDSTEDTLIGAAVGGGLGYMVGTEADKKKAAKEREALRQEMNTVMVNVVNSNGSVIQVPLKRDGIGYRGPRGEFYDHLPTGEELAPVYGF